MEIKRLRLIKRFLSSKKFGHSFPFSQNLASIYLVDEEFIKDGNIIINKKKLDELLTEKKKHGLQPIGVNKLKKEFFIRKEESPENIKKFYREQMKREGFYLKKKLEISFADKLLNRISSRLPNNG